MMNDKELLEKWIEYFWPGTEKNDEIKNTLTGIGASTVSFTNNWLAYRYLIVLSEILGIPCDCLTRSQDDVAVNCNGYIVTPAGTISKSNVLTDIVEFLSMSGEEFLPESIHEHMSRYVSEVLGTLEGQKELLAAKALVTRIGLLNGGSIKEQLDKAIRRWLAVGWLKYHDHPTYGDIDTLLVRYTVLHGFSEVFGEEFSVEYSAERDVFLVTLPGDNCSIDIVSPTAVYERLVTQNLTDVITAVDRYRLLVLITSMDDDSTAGTFRLTN